MSHRTYCLGKQQVYERLFMKDYRKIYIVTAFNIDKIRKLAKKKFVTPVWHNEPEIYLDRCYLVSKEYNTQTKKYIKTIQDVGPADTYANLEKVVKTYPDVQYTFNVSAVDVLGMTVGQYENYDYWRKILAEACESTKRQVKPVVSTQVETTTSTDYRDIEFTGITNLVNQLQNMTFRNRIAKTILDDTFDKTQEYKEQLNEIQEALVEKKRQDKLQLLGNQVAETLKDI